MAVIAAAIVATKPACSTGFDVLLPWVISPDASRPTGRQWRFEPTVINGKAVTVGTRVTVNFQLAKKKNR
jgi:hypothetical protein